MSTFKLGADPEYFLTKNGEAYSAYGVIPGTKAEPYKVDYGAIQVDGMAVEFNIDPVTLTDDFNGGDFEGFNNNITAVMNQLEVQAKKHDGDLSFNISPVQEFSDEVLKAQPEEAIELGCNPDYNAYTLLENPQPDGAAVNYRTASGHIHIGWGADIPQDHPDHIEICSSFVKYLDASVGLFMTIIDSDPRRRVLYGKAGAFRPKPYGVEYRTPSNAWLTSVDRRKAVFDLARMAVAAAKNQYKIRSICGYDEDQVQEIINEGDFEAAKIALDTLVSNFWSEFNVLGIVEKEYAKRVKSATPLAKKVTDNKKANKIWANTTNASYVADLKWIRV